MQVTTLAARAAHAAAVVVLAVTIAFVSLRILPGSALRAQQIEAGLSAASDEAGLDVHQLERPVFDQLLSFFAGLTRGDLGKSLYSGQPVGSMIAERLSSTVTLAAFGCVLTLILTAVIVCAAAVPRARVAVDALCVAGAATPTFITGTIVIGLIGVPSPSGIENVFAAACVLAIYVSSSFSISLNASIVETRRRSYIMTARAKGLRPRRVFLFHTVTNALRPLLGLLAGHVGFLLTGTVVTEALFTRGGIGRLLLDSVLRRDYPVVQGVVLYSAIVYVVGQVLAELFSSPRIAEHEGA